MREFSISQNIGKYGCRHEHHRSDQEYLHSYNEDEILLSYRNIDSLLNEEIDIKKLKKCLIKNFAKHFDAKIFYEN